MSKLKISVDDIIDEIKEKTHNPSQKTNFTPEKVDQLVEEIIKERMQKQIAAENGLTVEEQRELDKEIKFHTKAITRQYKKFVKTEQAIPQKIDNAFNVDKKKKIEFKELQKEQLASSKVVELHSSPELKEPLKVKPDTVPLVKANKEKADIISQAVHTGQIQKDVKAITDHFEKKVEEESENDKENEPITPSMYKTYRQNRDEKINSFNLNPPEAALEAPEIDEIDPEPADEPLEEYPHEYTTPIHQRALKKILSSAVLRNKIAMIVATPLFILSLMQIFVTVSEIGELKMLNTFSIRATSYATFCFSTLLMMSLLMLVNIKEIIVRLKKRKANKDVYFILISIITLAINSYFISNPNFINQSAVYLFTPVITISIGFNIVSSFFKHKLMYDNFVDLTDAEKIFVASEIEDSELTYVLTKGLVEKAPSILKNQETAFATHFFQKMQSPDHSDIVGKKNIFIALPVCLIVSAIAFIVTKDSVLYLNALVSSLALCSGFVLPLMYILPMFETSSMIKACSGISSTTAAITDYNEVNAITVDASDLFPGQSVSLYGLKTFSNSQIDENILYCVSVMYTAKSTLTEPLLEIIRHKLNMLKPVDSFCYEDKMGLSAWVEEKKILIGNRDLMLNHSITIPDLTQESKYNKQGFDVVYLSVDGVLCAAFILNVTPDPHIFPAVSSLSKNGIKMFVKTNDSFITAERIMKSFQLNDGDVNIIPERLHSAVSEATAPRKEAPATILNNGTIIGFILSIVTAKKLNYCANVARLMNSFGIWGGFIVTTTLIISNQLLFITPPLLLTYMSMVFVIFYLYQKNMKL